MNQLYRALHIPPKRLLRKLSGEKEIYTIAVRPVPKAEGTEPLPALGGTAPTRCCPAARAGGSPTRCSATGAASRWLFAEAMDLATGLGPAWRCASCTTTARQGTAGSVALEEDFPPLLPDGV